MDIMGIIWTILAGFVAGVIAKFIMPGEQKAGFWLTSLLGIFGAVVGGYLFNGGESYTGTFDPKSLLFSVIGAIIVLFVYGLVTRKR